jgi:hypothetical protein
MNGSDCSLHALPTSQDKFTPFLAKGADLKTKLSYVTKLQCMLSLPSTSVPRSVLFVVNFFSKQPYYLLVARCTAAVLARQQYETGLGEKSSWACPFL